jgi:hypothetical protein
MQSFSEIIESIDELVYTGQTGTVNVLTDSKTYAHIGLVNGIIIHCLYGRYRGEDALPHLEEIHSGSYSFWEGVVSDSPAEALPSSNEILQRLHEVADQSLLQVPSDPGAYAEDRPEENGAFEPAKVFANAIAEEFDDMPICGEELFDCVTEELARYVGPIAEMVMSDYESAMKSVTTVAQLKEVLLQIGKEIDDSSEADTFLHHVVDSVSMDV